MEINNERFKEVVEANCEVEVDFADLMQNIKINSDGNFESIGGGMHVILTPDYEIELLIGGVSEKASKNLMNDDYECDIL